MSPRANSSRGWSFGRDGSIWQDGGQSSTRNSFDHNPDHDSGWQGWHSDLDYAHERPRTEQQPPSSLPFPPPDSNANTLYMGDLEPWMDHEYASQVVHIMGWDRASNSNGMQNGAVTIKIPPPSSDAVPQPNNPGYCLITFPSAAQAANVLASLHSGTNNKDPAPLLMPNSSRPFNLQWASSMNASAGTAAFPGCVQNAAGINGMLINPGSANPGPQREFSIFVGDLAPQTSNSDLVAVFRNPVLGLRNDRCGTGYGL